MEGSAEQKYERYVGREYQEWAEQEHLEAAYKEYLDRQSRTSHPAGSCDRGGRWYPDEGERQSCCKRVRAPSRAYPWSYMTHCRTLGHVARVFGVEPAALRALHGERRERKAPAREGGDGYYKVVARDGDRLVSIYDGETEYVVGRELAEAARQDHGGGFYVYDSPEAARSAPFPARSALADAERVLLRVRAAGSYCRYANGKLAFSRITPLEVVE